MRIYNNCEWSMFNVWEGEILITAGYYRVLRNTDTSRTDTTSCSWTIDTTATHSGASTGTFSGVAITGYFDTYVHHYFPPKKVFFQPWKEEPPIEKFRRVVQRVFVLCRQIVIRKRGVSIKHKSRQYYRKGIK